MSCTPKLCSLDNILGLCSMVAIQRGWSSPFFTRKQGVSPKHCLLFIPVLSPAYLKIVGHNHLCLDEYVMDIGCSRVRPHQLYSKPQPEQIIGQLASDRDQARKGFFPPQYILGGFFFNLLPVKHWGDQSWR